jgi:hypothetical protein
MGSELVSGVAAWEVPVRHVHLQKTAKRLPSIGWREDEQSVRWNGIANLFIVAPIGLDCAVLIGADGSQRGDR